MKVFFIFIVLAAARLCQSQVLPLRLPVSSDSQQCQHSDIQIEDDSFEKVSQALTERYGPPGGVCGGPGWQPLLSLNMSTEGEECPAEWTKITDPIVACTRGKDTKRAAVILTPNITYSLVCGRVLAYQGGETDAFKAYIEGLATSLDLPYIDGVSLTYGRQPRQHIWSIAAGVSEISNGTKLIRRCPCSVENFPFKLPDFVKSDYFCDSGNVGPSVIERLVYTDRLLWSGNGCYSSSRCCKFNSPPWFYSKLPSPTSEDIELTIMNSVKSYNENIYVTVVDIYIQ